mmetsp:Transcript_46416/g.135195  ORF Transcript_46416/g.135195 Transcript_46416/m.135195 type:complete len:239 (-) Transcript_46416:337-1053(-)
MPWAPAGRPEQARPASAAGGACARRARPLARHEAEGLLMHLHLQAGLLLREQLRRRPSAGAQLRRSADEYVERGRLVICLGPAACLGAGRTQPIREVLLRRRGGEALGRHPHVGAGRALARAALGVGELTMAQGRVDVRRQHVRAKLEEALAAQGPVDERRIAPGFHLRRESDGWRDADAADDESHGAGPLRRREDAGAAVGAFDADLVTLQVRARQAARVASGGLDDEADGALGAAG